MTLSFALLLALSIAAAPSTPEAPQHVRRFALVAGANDGGTHRVLLRYATTDAEAVARVLAGLGGVAPADQRLLLNPDRAALERAIAELGGQMAAARPDGGRREILLYYSGHSDEEGLLLKGERVGYRELRQKLELLPADVRIVVLDSCGSGAVTRAKGGVTRPSFLSDASSRVRGHAFLTSSSADELAQESDRLGASFFTHFLVSGLRGAADASRDGKVTLNEAYQFAFAETLARTERTQGGAQHPAYDIQLVGSGDLVMTDLRATDARLAVGADVDGRVFVRKAEGPLAAELPKAGGRVLELGLEAGTYDLTVEKNGQVFRARFNLERDGRLEVGQRDLTRSDRELTVSRGGRPAETEPRRVVLNASFVPALSLNGPDDQGILNHFAFSVVGRAGHLEGLAMSLVGSWIHEDLTGVQFALGANGVAGEASGAQLAGVANSAGVLRGAQVAAGLNRAERQMRFAQFAGGANWSGGPATGVQLAGGGNFAVERLRGFQAAGALNVAAAGGAGVQLAAVNLTGDWKGVQLGVVNVGNQVRGLQVGVVNISEDADATLGLVNVVRGRRPNLGAFYSESFLVNANVRSGGRSLHSLFLGGYQPARGTIPARYLVGAGLGAKIPLAMMYLGSDLTLGSVRYTDQRFFGGPGAALTLLSTLKVNLGWTLTPWAAVYVGGSINHLFTTQDRRELGLRGGTDLTGTVPGGIANRLFPGFHAGAEL